MRCSAQRARVLLIPEPAAEGAVRVWGKRSKCSTFRPAFVITGELRPLLDALRTTR